VFTSFGAAVFFEHDARETQRSLQICRQSDVCQLFQLTLIDLIDLRPLSNIRIMLIT